MDYCAISTLSSLSGFRKLQTMGKLCVLFDKCAISHSSTGRLLPCVVLDNVVGKPLAY